MDQTRVLRNIVVLVIHLAGLALGSARAPADALAAIAEPVDITGRATDEQGRPVGGATVYLASTNPTRAAEPLLITTTSAADGTYEFRRVTLPMIRGETALEARFDVYGTALGYGFTWQGSRVYRPIPAPADVPADQRGRVFYKNEPIATELNFALPAAVSGRVVDDSGNPLAGARVELGVIQNERTGRPTWNCSYLESNPRRIHRDDRSFSAMWLLPESFCTAETDQDGNFTIFGLPREANLIGRIAYKPGYEEKRFSLATTTGPLPKKECIGYDGVLNHTFQSPRVVQVQVEFADSKTPASNTHVRVRAARVRHHEAEGNTDQQGRLELNLTPGEYTLIFEPQLQEPYVRSEQRIVVADQSVQQSVSHSLQRGAAVVLSAIDVDSQLPIQGVDFLVGPDTTPQRQVLQSGTVFVDNPATDERGELRALLAEGTYQFVVNTIPRGYQAVRKTSDPCQLVATNPANVRFEFRRVASPPESPADDSPLPTELAEKWLHQASLLERGLATIDIHRGADSWLQKDSLETILAGLDADTIPDLAGTLRKKYPDHEFDFGQMEVLCDGQKYRVASSYLKSGTRHDSGVIVSNGKEAVNRSADNPQADVFDLRAFNQKAVSLRDLCHWPRPFAVKAKDQDATNVAIERENGRITFAMEQNNTAYRVIADEATGFVYLSSFANANDGRQTWQFAPKRYANGAILPGLSVEYSYNRGRVTILTAYRVRSYEPTMSIAPNTFSLSAPAGTQVLDHRGGDVRNPKRAVAYEPITDLVAFANTIPSSNRRLSEIVKAGDVAPALKPALWLSPDGESAAPDLSGKRLLVEFWGIGCGPCLKQLPEVQQAAERYAERGVLVIGLHGSGETTEAVSNVTRKLGLTYPIAIDNPADDFFGATFAAFGVHAIPQTALIDRDGRIVHLGYWDECVSRLDELLRRDSD